MNKKLIALILVLPMVLMMTLFTAVNTVKLNVKVPVSKIEIMGDEFVSLNLDKNERYYVDYVVYPTTAANKKVTFSVEKVGEQPKAELEYKDGFIYPKSAGSAYACFSTVDGGYKARFQVVVKSTQLKEISCSIEKTTLIVGEKAQIQTEFIPQSATDKALEYESSSNNVVSVDDEGLLTAKGKGMATITIRSLTNPSIFDTIDVIVNAEQILSLGETEITTWNATGAISLAVDTLEEYQLSYKVFDENSVELTDAIKPIDQQQIFTDLGDGNFKFEYEFVDRSFYGTIVVDFTISTPTQTLTKSCVISRIENLTAQFKSQDEICMQVGTVNFKWKDQINILPKDADIDFNVEYSNSNLREGSTEYLANALKMGYTKATITIQSKEYSNQNVVLEKDIYVCPDELVITQGIRNYGIEDVFTIGKTDVNGNEVFHDVTLSFDANEKGVNFDKLEEKIVFETSQPEKVKIENGKIKILDNSINDIVNISAKLDLHTGIESEKFVVRCVGAGVEVNNFLDLVQATKGSKAVVLQGDIIDDFGIDASGNNYYQGANIQKIDSTYDTRYYTNKSTIPPQVITLLQFKNNLYGNGHVINADNVTNVSDADRFAGKALFTGPLNFVAMGNMASVKAQDNICFAVFENVTINNVELKGCTLQGKDGEQDLTDLDFMGTIVEVLGDNINIEYSRINNGRTVVRAFGDINDSEKVVNVNVKNSVLSCAREFIIRIGSNAFVHDTRALNEINFETYDSPYIDSSEPLDLPIQASYDSTQEYYQRYEEKYIKTKMTIENSVLKDSGIFCIGIDSHFSGPMLYDALEAFPSLKNSGFKEGLSTWKGLSSTSYGAKVTLNGDVRMYDWKKLDNIDSSTLIEMGPEADDTLFETLKFDVKEMINELDNTPMVYYDDNNDQYVHGGIVLFGGGKNYGILEDNSQSFSGIEGIDSGASFALSEYTISLSDVGQDLLEKAAGNRPFYFMLYSANSKFNPHSQAVILDGDSAYNCIYYK
ncbi:MAG: Ig-like domain-containing protein [Clostridia bacterium]|nr:Ig-like domain-containing protein [Clostridia bacterium]